MQEIDVFEDISQKTIEKFSCLLSSIDGGGELVINIASYGGELLPTIAIIDMIRGKHLRTTANIIGFAASAAAILALSCDKVNMTPLGSIMIHSAWREGADSDDPGIQRCNEIQMQILRKRCKCIDSASLQHDTWFDAEQCLKLGLVDGICDNVSNTLKNECYRYVASGKRGYSAMEEKVQEIIEEFKKEETPESPTEGSTEEVVPEDEQIKAEEEVKPDVWQAIEHLGALIAALSERIDRLEPKEVVPVEAACDDGDEERINSIYKNIMQAKVAMPQPAVAIGKQQPSIKTYAKVDTKLYKSFLND